MSGNKTKIAVYVWEWPVRWFHWVNALAITILVITGLYIGSPFTVNVDPSVHVMGWVRTIHFITAYVFSVNLLFRLYWMYKGNKYAKSNPLTRSFWQGVWKTIKHYLFIGELHDSSVGHNPMAQLAYWIFIGLGGLVQIVTGFAMQGEPYANTWKGAWLEWLRTLLGSGDAIHYVHHLVAWLIVAFIFIHLYLVFRAEYLENNGEVSSMFSGYKFIEVDEEEAQVDAHRHSRAG